MTDSDGAHIAWRDVRERHWIAARKAEYLAGGRLDEDLAEQLARQDWAAGPGGSTRRSSTVGFHGGPWDGDAVEGLIVWAIRTHLPVFFCVDADGRHEHYVSAEPCQDHGLCFTHAGPCRDLSPHPDPVPHEH